HSDPSFLVRAGRPCSARIEATSSAFVSRAGGTPTLPVISGGHPNSHRGHLQGRFIIPYRPNDHSMCETHFMLSTLLFSVTLALAPVHGNDDLLTVAEKSGYTETATYEEVMTLATAIANSADHITLIEMGTTVEGRSIPILLLANPPITTAAEARESGKLLIFAFANIHAGEVCGKEAFLMLARELA